MMAQPGTLPRARPDAPERTALHDYQEEALAAVAEALGRGVGRQLIVLPTGTGKTLIAARLPERIGDPATLFSVHREELLHQALSTFRKERPDRPVGLERAASKAPPDARTVVASIQSLAHPKRLARYRAADWPLMIIDEAHRTAAPTYRHVLEHLQYLPAGTRPARTDRALLVGVTATSRRTDQVGLGAIYQEVVYTRTLRDMIEAGWLVPLRGYLLRGGANLDRINLTMQDDGERDYDPRALARAINTPERNQLVVDRTRHLVAGRPTLVFAVDVDHATTLAGLFRNAGVRAESIDGRMSFPHRAEIIDRFKAGEIEVLCNCQVLVEGFDYPAIGAIVMARPTHSALFYTQCLGRATRLYPGKSDAIVLDFVDNTPQHAPSLVTLPTLVGLPPAFDLTGAAAHEMAQQFEDVASTVATGLDESVVQRIRTPQDLQWVLVEVDLFRIAGMPPKLHQMTDFSWQRMPDGVFVLNIPRARAADPPLQAPGGEMGVRIEIAENVVGHYEVRRRPWSGAVTKVGEFADVERALRVADSEVRSGYRDRLVLLDKNARWRHEPATEKQLEWLRSLGLPTPPTLTKGLAATLIDRALALKRGQKPTG